MERIENIHGHLSEVLGVHMVKLSLRGSGSARFLYIEHGDRAVELSLDDHSKIWVEYWDDSPDENAPPVKEMTFETNKEAEESVCSWFIRNTGGSD